MKKIVSEFLRRGLMACGLGPIVFAVLYLILQQAENVNVLTVNQMCIGVFSLTILAFIAGGMNVIYQVERLPLMVAILIHGGVLYVSYFITYLLNDWLEWGVMPILGFSGVFVMGYLIIWVIIYSIIRRRTENINLLLQQKRRNTEK